MSERPITPDHVWVVSRWLWGGGGDDDRRIVAVCSTSERAYEIAAEVEADRGREFDDVIVEAYPLDEIVKAD